MKNENNRYIHESKTSPSNKIGNLASGEYQTIYQLYNNKVIEWIILAISTSLFLLIDLNAHIYKGFFLDGK